MATCVGVVFSPGGKVQRYTAGELTLRWNDHVVCQTPKGEELGRVVLAPHDWAPEGGSTPGPVLRVATAADERAKHEHDEAAAELLRHLRELLRRDSSPASAVRCDISLDGSRASVWYRADERIELRGVAGELSRRSGRRVELRQAPPREAARLCEGGGLCGPIKCCNRYPSHEQPITLRMAKDQELPMNPGRITGLCGRLRCCLAFEHPVYRSFRDRAPAVGRTVDTPSGRGVVRSYKVPQDALVVRVPCVEKDIDVRLDDAVEVA
jgi:cell fate regulator YaaT (PSP1 superfamily)